MKAVQFKLSVPKYLLTKTLGAQLRGITTSPFSCVSLKEVPVPAPLNDRWVRIRTLKSGICGSDISVINGKTSFYLEPYGSDSFVFGHEIVGEIVERSPGVKNFKEGDRVVVDPTLSCVPRGIQKLCRHCRKGENHLCENLTNGHLHPASSIGFSKDTGGGWGEYFIAHVSQLFKIPGGMPLERGVLVEPLSVALHAVLRRYPPPNGTALVIGCGTMGLLTVAAMRMLNLKCKIIVVSKYDFQRDAAYEFGASKVVNAGSEDLYEIVAHETRGKIMKPSLGKRVVEGGVNCVYDTVAYSGTIDDSLRVTAPGGAVVVVGSAGRVRGIDLTPVWFREVDLLGAFAYSVEHHKGKKRKTFSMAIELMKRNRKIPLEKLVTHQFPLDRWIKAIKTAQTRRNTGAIKVVFSGE